MISGLMIGLGVLVVLLAVVVPPALLAGRIVEIYDSIPEKVKLDYGLTKKEAVRPATWKESLCFLIFYMGMMLWRWHPSKILNAFALLWVTGFGLWLLWRAGYYFRLARLKGDVPEALPRYARYAAWGMVAAAAGVLAMSWVFWESVIMGS